MRWHGELTVQKYLFNFNKGSATPMASSCSSPPAVPKRPGSPRAVGGGVFPIMTDTGRLRQKGVPFSGFRCTKGKGFYSLKYMKG